MSRRAAEEFLGRPMSDGEYDYLLRATAAEASRNPEERAAVAGVILNRVRMGFGGGESVRDILYQRNQFQSVTGDSVNRQPHRNFTQTSPETKASVEAAIGQYISRVPQSWQNFTAADPSAYGPGTDPGFLDDMNASGGQRIGGTIFGTQGGTNETMVTAQRAGANGDNRTVGESANERVGRIAQNIKTGAGVAGLAYGGYRAARFLLGRRFGLGLLAGNMLGDGDEQAPQPMGFGAVTNNAVGTGPVAMPTTNKTSFGAPLRAKNSGRSQGVDKADVLEKSGDNLKDVESILQDIRDDIRLIVDNTKEKPLKPGETTEEQIRAGFANSKAVQGMAGLGRSAAMGALGMTGLLAAGSMFGDDGGGDGGSEFGPFYDEQDRRTERPFDLGTGLPGVVGAAGNFNTARRLQTGGLTPEPPASTGVGTDGRPAKVRNFYVENGKFYSKRTGEELRDAALESSRAAHMRDMDARKVGNGFRAKIARATSRFVSKKARGMVGRAIPLLGTALGAYDAISRTLEGDMEGAAMSVAAGAATLVPGIGTAAGVGLIAAAGVRDIYNEIYGTEENPYPYSSDAVNNYEEWKSRQGAIANELAMQLADWWDRNVSTEADSQNMALQAAEESGFYEDPFFGKDSINLDMLPNVPTNQLAAILNADDLSANDVMAINNELDRRADSTLIDASELEAVSGQGAGAVPSGGVETATDNYQGAMNTGTSQAPIVVPVPQQLASNGNNQAPVTNIFYGDPMTPKFRGAGQYIARELA